MKTLQNTEIINQFIQTIPSLQNTLNKTKEEMEGYLKFYER